MAKKIVVLTGSPRKKGNANALADAFIKGAEKQGHSVKRFDTANMDILGCVACNGCYKKKDRACAYKDDFNDMAPALEKADAIVFITPLYWYSFPAKLKAAIDKFYALIVGEKPLQGKESAMIVCGADDVDTGFEGIFKSYQTIADYLQWKVVATLAVTGVDKKGAVEGTGWIRQAEELGKAF